MSADLNLLKLSVGVENVEHLEQFVDRRVKTEGRAFHTTRMVPKQREALLDGGSIYWIIKGQVQARQRLDDIETFTDSQGIRRCRLILDPALIRTQWQPRRPFQGWRYLKREDAPRDLEAGEDALPEALRLELTELGLL